MVGRFAALTLNHLNGPLGIRLGWEPRTVASVAAGDYQN